MLYSIRIKFKSLLCGYPTSPTHLYSLKRLSLLREIALTPLWKLFGLLCEGLFLGFSPSHWSISLSVGQCAITVITVALQLALKSEHVISPALFFFKIVFCILCPVCKNFRMVFFPLFFFGGWVLLKMLQNEVLSKRPEPLLSGESSESSFLLPLSSWLGLWLWRGRAPSPCIADEALGVDIGQGLCKQAGRARWALTPADLMQALIFCDGHLIFRQDRGG